MLGQVLDGMKPDAAPVAGEKNDPLMPIAWTRTYAGDDGARGRVFTHHDGRGDATSSPRERGACSSTASTGRSDMEDAIPPDGTDGRPRRRRSLRPTSASAARKRGVRPGDHALGQVGIEPPRPDPGGRFAIAPGTRLVLVGNTFAERLAFSGYFEALAHAAHPDRRSSSSATCPGRRTR